MWKLRNIEIRNICTLKDVCYSFNQGVTTLVFGHNLDNEGQKNNGSGKSALIEAIVFGLTGSPLRNVKNDEIINNDEKEAYIRLLLENSSSGIELDIERRIYRKGSPDITVSMYRDGKIVDDGTTTKSGVDEYNRYILELIGLTKDDIYNSYILSKHKYQDFLSASDREKKEIINRFSNGNLVDQSIAAVQLDRKPLEDELNGIRLELSNYDGRISALEEQIVTEEENAESRRVSRVSKIREAKEKIEQYKADISRLLKDKADIDIKIIDCKEANSHLNEIDESGDGKELSKLIADIKGLVLHLVDIDYDIDAITTEESKLRYEIISVGDKLDNLIKCKNSLSEQYYALKSSYSNEEAEYQKQKDAYNQKIKENDSESESVSSRCYDVGLNIVNSRAKIMDKNNEILYLQKKKDGAITCPHCNQRFVLGEEDFDINQVDAMIQSLKANIGDIETSILLMTKDDEHLKKRRSDLERENYSLRKQIMTLETKCSDAKGAIYKMSDEISRYDMQIETYTDKIESLKKKLSNLKDKMFDDLFDDISRYYIRLERSGNDLAETISSYKGIISSSEELIFRLENEDEKSVISSLQDSLRMSRKKRAVVYRKHNDIEDQVNCLSEQEARFVSFKTYLANSKVEALNIITNDFLEQIGSDLRVKFDGFTVLKSGKVRDKISVSLLRDGIEAGSFSKFSEGEKARIQLATILAMHTLTNNNADIDKGLDLLVLDEILAAVDEEGLSFILESLNKLHITSLVVSHGKTAESYPHQLLITKKNGVSRIG